VLPIEKVTLPVGRTPKLLLVNVAVTTVLPPVATVVGLAARAVAVGAWTTVNAIGVVLVLAE
jgi:hypothetical protein